MAELVHLRMEECLPELEEMERVGLFTKKEINAVIKRRKALEYKSRRKTKRKEDYLKLIEYEMNLLNLIGKRRLRFLCEDKKKEIDISIAKRINKLFKAVISRYPEDEKLFLDQIQFCKEMKWHEFINVLYTRLLQVHSRTPELWVMATKWEMEELRSPETARKLIQRGILLNPDSEILWREYYRMELMYTDMMKKRKKVFEHQAQENSDQDDIVLSGEIPNVVYTKAMEEFNDIELGLSFIQICLDFDFGKNHIDYILKDLTERFPDDPQVIDAVAKRPLLDVEDQIKEGKKNGIKKRHVLARISSEICQNYEEAIEKIQNEKMFSVYFDFLLSLLEKAKESKKLELQNKLIDFMGKAAATNHLHISYYTKWMDLLYETRDKDIALSTSIEAARKFRKEDLWTHCLTYHVQCMESPEYVYSLLNEAINSVEEKDSIPLWRFGVEWLSMCDSERLSEFFERGLKKCPEISGPIKEMYLETTALEHGIEATRTLYKRFKKSGPLIPQLIKKMITLEQGQFESSITVIRKYFEDGIKEFGAKNIDIWLEFMKFETEHNRGDPELCDVLYWRAKKMLDADLMQELNTRTLELTSKSSLSSNMLTAS